MNSVISTVRDQKLMGVLHTTWHTLSKGMPYVTHAAVGSFEGIDACVPRRIRTSTAALLRRVLPAAGDYEKAGWSKIQVDDLW